MTRVLALAAASFLLVSAPALAQMTPGPATPGATVTPGTTLAVPAQSISMNEWIRQSVYDNANNKIGDIADVLLDGGARANLAVLGVGGFLGIGEKNVAVPFDSIKRSIRDGKVYLTMDTSKDALKAAAGLRFDRVTNSWVPDTTPASTNPPVRQ